MASKSEGILFDNFIFSSDEWLERKKKLDGAEGLWRIHDKLYDLTLWSREHPGGKFWLDKTRGTDITEAFESYHLTDKAESLLENFYRREAQTQRNSSITFREDGFYKTFKRRIREQNLTSAIAQGHRSALLIDGLVVAVFLTALLGVKYGMFWVIISGVLLGTLSASLHNVLHMKDNWRTNYFNLSLMSSSDWIIRHVLSHHQFRNTVLDLEVATWQPFLKLFPVKNSNTLIKFLQGTSNLFYYTVAAHIQFLKRFFDVFLSRKLAFDPEEHFGCFPLVFLILFAGLWHGFVIWNLIIAIGSFVFCVLNSSFTPRHPQIKWEEDFEKDEQDFGIIQISLAPNHSDLYGSVFSVLNSLRKSTLHYLCPSIDSTKLGFLHPVFEKTCSEFGILLKVNKEGFLSGLTNEPPQGHVFFS